MTVKFKSIFLAAILLISAFAAAACAKGGETLSIMGKKSDMDKSYMRSIIEQYESAKNVKIKVIAVEDSEFETEAAKRYEEGKDIPDILMHFHNSDLGRFDVEKDFYSLNGEAWTDELTDSAASYCTDENGNLLGLPFWESSVSGCYYNKTILDGLGLKPAANQAEFDVLCQALKDVGCTPICWPGDNCAWMVQFGLDPIFADHPENLEKINSGEASYSDFPEIKNMVEWIKSAAEKGWFGEDYLSCGWDGISDDMGSGDAVMTFIWDTWFYTDFKPGQKYSVDDFALMPVFLNTVDGGTYEGGNLNMMMVSRDGKNFEGALDFLSFCADPENYNVAFDGISTVSCFKNQTTNIQSKMVTEAADSLAEKERVSTAASRIIGYSGDDMVYALGEMFRGKTDADGCVRMMDEMREKEIAAGYAE